MKLLIDLVAIIGLLVALGAAKVLLRTNPNLAILCIAGGGGLVYLYGYFYPQIKK